MGIEKEEPIDDRYSEYQAKLTTLDLEISLTQNLFKNLSQTIARGSSAKKYIFCNLEEI